MVDAPFVIQDVFDSASGDVGGELMKRQVRQLQQDKVTLEKERNALQVKLEETHSKLTKVYIWVSVLMCWPIGLCVCGVFYLCLLCTR